MSFEITIDTEEVLELSEDLLMPWWVVLVIIVATNIVTYFVLNSGSVNNFLFYILLIDSFVFGFLFFSCQKITSSFDKRNKTFEVREKKLLGTRTTRGKFSNIVHVFHKKRYDATPFQSDRRNSDYHLSGKSRLELLLDSDKILILNRRAHQEFDPYKTQFGIYEAEIGKHLAKLIDKPFIDDYSYA